MKRMLILLCDLVAAVAIGGWALRGPWDRMLGFDVYRSRGNVWLPTPPAAAGFFRGMVGTGALIFAGCFLLASLLIFSLRSARPSAAARGQGILGQAFYGDARQLFVKYSALLVASFFAPFFYSFMWRFPVTRSARIAGGLAINLAVFVVVLAAGGLIARVASPQQTALNI